MAQLQISSVPPAETDDTPIQVQKSSKLVASDKPTLSYVQILKKEWPAQPV